MLDYNLLLIGDYSVGNLLFLLNLLLVNSMKVAKLLLE